MIDLEKRNFSEAIIGGGATINGLFLKENLHLIDSLYLSRNNSKWVVDFILDPLIINYIEIYSFARLAQW